MSRVGKNPVAMPQGVEANVVGRELTVKGKNGELQFTVPAEIKTAIEENEIVFTLGTTSKQAKAFWGLSRAMVANMVKGVSEGFTKVLEINGVGYRAAVKGNKLDLSLAFSHPVEMEIPSDLKVEVKGNEITITGADKQRVGQFAADVRAWRKPEPYKGKGIKYKEEHIVRKEGKKK
ncbi:MAG TPA: 50S ribosomal protein L6 [Alphaproteobacteria bacterium]|nr:50S ribosomal protein L6 [Alphaproteobacteria bacterium]